MGQGGDYRKKSSQDEAKKAKASDKEIDVLLTILAHTRRLGRLWLGVILRLGLLVGCRMVIILWRVFRRILVHFRSLGRRLLLDEWRIRMKLPLARRQRRTR